MCDCTIAIKKFNAPFNLQFQWNGKKPFWNFSRKILETLWTPNRSLLQHCPLELAEFEAHHLQTVVDSSDDVVSWCRKISCFQSLQNCSAVMVIQFWFHNFFFVKSHGHIHILSKKQSSVIVYRKKKKCFWLLVPAIIILVISEKL